MQENNLWKKGLPYAAAIVIFIAISFAFLYPVMQGKQMRQHDITIFKGMSKEIVDHRAAHGEEPLWTNSMFGGMPAYQISTLYPNNWAKKIDRLITLNLPRPVNLMFLYFVGFFILMLALGVGPWTAALGALAFAFSSYFIIILEAGHNSKAHAIAYMAPLMAGVWLTYKKRYVLGGALTLLFAALEISTNHFQITYYILIALLLLAAVVLAEHIKQKRLLDFAKASAILLLAGGLAILPNITNLMVTSEYSKYSTRGQADLAKEAHIQTTGLDKDYATQWSYGIGESWSLLIPNAKGGGSGALANNKKAMQNLSPQMKQAMMQMRVSSYWGDQPFTAGPTYAGAVVVLLFLLALFYTRGPWKWAMIATALLGMLLAWGKNFMPLTNAFLDYFPFYNKFRSVSMILVLAELAIPALAFWGLWQLISQAEQWRQKKKPFLIVWGALQGLLLLFFLFPNIFFNFLSQMEATQIAGNTNAQIVDFFHTVEQARITIFKADVLRSSLFVLLAGALLYAFMYNKIQKTWLLAGLSLLLLTDMYGVARRYVDADDFESKSKIQRPYTASVADKSIMQDKSLDYRVLNLNNPFNDGATSYFHKSVGGYHAAKMSRYQELIENGLDTEINGFITALQASKGDMTIVDNAMLTLPLLDMLNTKYLIYNPSAPALANPHANGNAWFVQKLEWAPSAQAEIDALHRIDPKNTAVVNAKYKDMLSASPSTWQTDSTAQVQLLSYQPNRLEYKYHTAKPGFIVFSEIYYPKGWKAYIDGKETPYMCADYVLRAMAVPAGTHSIQFVFHPHTYHQGESIALFGSILMLLIVLGALAYQLRQQWQQHLKAQK